MQRRERVEDALLQLRDAVGVQQQLAVRRRARAPTSLPAADELRDERLGLVGADAGAADEVGRRRSPPNPANHATVERPRLGVVASRAARPARATSRCRRRIFAGDRLQHLPAAERVLGRRVAQDERLAPDRRHRLFEEELRQPPLARLDLVAVEQRDGRHHLGRADVQPHRQPVLDRPADLGRRARAGP